LQDHPLLVGVSGYVGGNSDFYRDTNASSQDFFVAMSVGFPSGWPGNQDPYRSSPAAIFSSLLFGSQWTRSIVDF
jgi:hypothetical protein